MPKAVNTTTTPSPDALVGRRRLASGAALLAAFGSVGPFAGSAEAATRVDTNKTATVEDYATVTFEPWPPGTIEKIGDRAKWNRRTDEDYPVIFLAAAAMERTPEQLAAIGDEETAVASVEIAEHLLDMVERYRGLSEMLQAAQLRIMAGLSRHLVATGEA